MSRPTLIQVIDVITAPGKEDIPNTAALNIAATSLLPKPLNTASFYLVVDGLVDNLDTYIEDSDFIMAKPLDILQLLNNNYLTV